MKRLRSAALLLAALLASPFVHAQARCGDGAGATVCLTATGSSSDVTLSWKATDAIESVQVYRDTDGDPAGRTLLASVDPGPPRSVDSGAAAEKPYWYWVRFTAATKPRDSNAAAA